MSNKHRLSRELRPSIESLESRKLLTVTVTDFDNDGDFDFVTSGYWYENVNGSGRNLQQHEFDNHFMLDIDQDGDMDAIRDDGFWYEYNGQGEFVASHEFGPVSNIAELKPIDAGNDGDLDFVGVTKWPIRDLFFFEQVSPDRFQVREVFKNAPPDLSTIGDTNGDGRLDRVYILREDNGEDPASESYETTYNIVAASERAPEVRTLLSYTIPTPIHGTPDFPNRAALADIDGDGIDDLVVGWIVDFMETTRVVWHANDGIGRVGKAQEIYEAYTFMSRTSETFVDLDGDGDLDAIIHESYQGFGGSWEGQWYQVNAGNRFSQFRLAEGVPQSLLDINSDGVRDVAYLDYWSNEATGHIHYYDPSDAVSRIGLYQRLIREEEYWDDFDLNSDRELDQQDLDYFILERLDSVYGDANLDGIFNSADLVQVFQANEYEDDVDANSTWAEGDWNGDGEFSSADLTFVFSRGGYEQSAVRTNEIAAWLDASNRKIVSLGPSKPLHR
ncbi:MAG: FG-GAP-like repeat-containing protein [Pirellulaceae bacterium]